MVDEAAVCCRQSQPQHSQCSYMYTSM